MIQVIGDGFAAASYAACQYSWASQDTSHKLKGQTTHPKNYNVSFAKLLSDILHNGITINAYDFITCDDIFDIAMRTNASHIVITWPNLYKGQVFHNDEMVYFNFNDIDKFIPEVRTKMYEYMSGFELATVQSQFIVKLQLLIEYLNSKNTKHVMLMSDSTMPTDIGNWLWDPKIFNIKSWAMELGYLNEYDYLNINGHRKLSQLIAMNLTNQ